MYKELVLELSGGTPEGPQTRFFFERKMTARMRVIHATPTASWENIHATGRPEDVAALRELLEYGPVPPMEDVEIVSASPRSIQYVVKWSRPSNTDPGVPLDFMLHDVVGPDAMYSMTMQPGRIRVTVAGGDGAKLLAYFNRVREQVSARFDVRLVRVGDLSGAAMDAATAALRDMRAEDRSLVELALASGYYDNPKRCGVRDLGDALGCSKSVVARKLRTIERRALESLLKPDRSSAPPAAPAPAAGMDLFQQPEPSALRL